MKQPTAHTVLAAALIMSAPVASSKRAVIICACIAWRLVGRPMRKRLLMRR